MALTKLGLYEKILDDATQTAVADLNQEDIQVLRRQLDEGDSHSYLVQHLARQIAFVLRSLPVEGRLAGQVALSNKIIDLLEAGAPAASKGTRANVTPQAELLLAIVRNKTERPDTPLGTSCLITGSVRPIGSLINFSNQQYYQGRLVTFPSNVTELPAAKKTALLTSLLGQIRIDFLQQLV